MKTICCQSGIAAGGQPAEPSSVQTESQVRTLSVGQSDIVQILLLNYGQEKHKSDIVQVLREGWTAEFSKWISLADFD